jgi:hypothetical protein
MAPITAVHRGIWGPLNSSDHTSRRSVVEGRKMATSMPLTFDGVGGWRGHGNDVRAHACALVLVDGLAAGPLDPWGRDRRPSTHRFGVPQPPAPARVQDGRPGGDAAHPRPKRAAGRSARVAGPDQGGASWLARPVRAGGAPAPSSRPANTTAAYQVQGRVGMDRPPGQKPSECAGELGHSAQNPTKYQISTIKTDSVVV